MCTSTVWGSSVAWSSWTVQGKLLHYDVALHQDCLIAAAATSNVDEETSLVRLLRALCSFCPGTKLNWSHGLFFWESVLCLSTVHILSHRKLLLESSWELLSWPGLCSHQYMQNHLLPQLKLQQNPEQFVLCLCYSPASPAVFPLQHLPPEDKHNLPDIYGENAQEMPLVQHTFTGFPLGNT